MKKRFTLPVILLLLTLSLTFVFAGCADNGQDIDLSTDESVVGTDTETKKKDLSEYIPLSKDGVPLYTVVYQTADLIDGTTISNYSNAASSIVSKLNELVPKANFKKLSGRTLPTDTKVIAVGNVKGVLEENFDKLRFNDWRIRENDGNVSVAAYTESALYISTERIKDNLEVIDGDVYLKKNVLDMSHHSSYHIETMTVGNTDIFDYVISYTGNNKELATYFRDAIRTFNGAILPMEENSSAAKSILIETSTDTEGYKVAKDGEKLKISYSGDLDKELLRLHIEKSFDDVKRNGSLDLDTLENELSISDGRKIISYNVLNVWNGSSAGVRDDATVRMIQGYAPDFVCLQEFDVGYRNSADGLIDCLSADYAEVNVDGVDKNEIWNPIFYDIDKYTVLETGWVYLPSVTSSNESGYNGFPNGKSRFRSLVWAVFEDKTTEEIFLIGNTHLSYENADEVQVGEVSVISGKLKEIAAKYDGCVTLLSGDLNSSRENASGGVSTFINNHGFKDTYDAAHHRNNYHTTHTSGNLPIAGYMKNAIDHVLSLNDLDVQTYLVLYDSDILEASDHCPTVVQFTTNQNS